MRSSFAWLQDTVAAETPSFADWPVSSGSRLARTFWPAVILFELLRECLTALHINLLWVKLMLLLRELDFLAENLVDEILRSEKNVLLNFSLNGSALVDLFGLLFDESYLKAGDVGAGAIDRAAAIVVSIAGVDLTTRTVRRITVSALMLVVLEVLTGLADLLLRPTLLRACKRRGRKRWTVRVLMHVRDSLSMLMRWGTHHRALQSHGGHDRRVLSELGYGNESVGFVSRR